MRTGGKPRLATALRVGLRDDNLVVRFDGRDEGTVATLARRDEPLWIEDVYEVFLSPFEPPTVYFEFEVNPLGTVFDARVESPDLARGTMRVDPSWNLRGFSARSRVRPGRWSAVLTIPLAPMIESLPPLPPREGRVEGESSGRELPRRWRANFYRIDRGARDEFSAWSPTFTDPADFHTAARFGRLELPAPDPSR